MFIVVVHHDTGLSGSISSTWYWNAYVRARPQHRSKRGKFYINLSTRTGNLRIFVNGVVKKTTGV